MISSGILGEEKYIFVFQSADVKSSLNDVTPCTEAWSLNLCTIILMSFFLKMGKPRPLFHLFLYFQTNNTTFATNKCEKCPSSIRCRDSNSQPLASESPPITTRPGLPPFLMSSFTFQNCQNTVSTFLEKCPLQKI